VTPWTVARHAPLSIGFFRQEYQSGLPCPPPGELPNPGIKARSPTLQADSLPSEPPGKPASGVVWQESKEKQKRKKKKKKNKKDIQELFKLICTFMGFPGGSMIQSLPASTRDRAQSLGREDPLEMEMATHSSIPAWEIPWMRSLMGCSPWGRKRVRLELATKQQTVTTYKRSRMGMCVCVYLMVRILITSRC